MSPLQELILLVAPPDNPIGTGTSEQWAQVEQDLGTQLPADYKALVDVYGCGRFADWIHVCSPFVALGSTNLIYRAYSFARLYREGIQIRPEDMPPYPPFPDTNGLLPWAWDDNESEFCWATSGPPESWPVINLDPDYTLEDHRVLNWTATELIAGWFAGRITGDWYPEDLDPKQMRYFISASYPLAISS